MELPGDLAVCVNKGGLMIPQQVFHGGFVIGEIAKGGGVFQGELERFERVIKADDAERTRRAPRGAKHGEDVRGGTQTDVPDHEFAAMRGQPFTEAQLFHVKRLSLRHRPDDGMKRLAMGKRMNAVHAAREFHEFITGTLLHVAGWTGQGNSAR